MRVLAEVLGRGSKPASIMTTAPSVTIEIVILLFARNPWSAWPGLCARGQTVVRRSQSTGDRTAASVCYEVSFEEESNRTGPIRGQKNSHEPSQPERDRIVLLPTRGSVARRGAACPRRQRRRSPETVNRKCFNAEGWRPCLTSAGAACCSFWCSAYVVLQEVCMERGPLRREVGRQFGD